MIDAVHRYDGYVGQSAGDGIFALFGARRLRLVTFILGASSFLSSMVEATIVCPRVRSIERVVVRPIRIQLRLKNRLLLLHRPASLTGPGAVVRETQRVGCAGQRERIAVIKRPRSSPVRRRKSTSPIFPG